MRQKTINVIEMEADDVVRLMAFDDSEEGRVEAGDLFCSLVKQHDQEAGEEDVQAFLDDSYYETGSYQLFLVASSAD